MKRGDPSVDLINEEFAMSKPSPEKQQPVFGIGFYHKDQWPQLLDTAGDREELEDTYDEWKLNLVKSVKNLQALGSIPLKVDIDLDELLAWCAGRGFKNTGENRAEFITDLLRQGGERRSRNGIWND